MSRVGEMIAQYFKSLARFQVKLFCDLGSTQTKIMVGPHVIFNQPTCVLVHKQTNSLISIGNKALAHWGKTPQTVETVFPIQQGVVADQNLAEQFLRAALKQIFPTQKVVQATGNLALPAVASSLDSEVLRDSLKNVKLAGIKLVPKTRALYHRLSPAIQSKNVFILDVGGQTTEIGLYSAGVKVLAQTMPLGGVSLTDRVKEVLKTQHHLEVSWQVAEQVKRQLANLGRDYSPLAVRPNQVMTRGKDMLNNLVKSVKASGTELEAVSLELANELLGEIQSILAQVPSQVVTDCLEQGIYLSGGTSRLAGLARFLSEQLKTEVIQSDQPELDLVKGLVADYDHAS